MKHPRTDLQARAAQIRHKATNLASMLSALRALLLLTFAVAAMAVAPATAPAPSPIAGIVIPNEKFLDFGGPMKCWKVIEGVQGCAAHFLKSLGDLNARFLPHCCKAIVGLPLNCVGWIFPLSIFGFSFGEQVNKLCNTFLGGGRILPLP